MLLLVLLTILPALGVILYTGWERRQRVSAQAQAEALMIAHRFARKQQDEIQATRQLLTTLALLLPIQTDGSAVCRALSAEWSRSDMPYASFHLIRPDGQVLCSATSNQKAIDAHDRVFLQQALETRAGVIGEYEINPAGQVVLPFFQPVLAHSQVTKVLQVTLSLAWFNSLAAHTQLPPGSALTVIDRDGTVFARSPNSATWIGRTARASPLVQTILAARGDGTAETAGLDGVTRLYGFTRFDAATNASISVGIPSAVIFAEEDGILARNLGLLALAAGMALAAAWGFGDVFIVRRVNGLLKATQRLTAGDLRARTEMRYGAGELNQLGQAFDAMAESLERREAEIRALNAELEQRVAERTAALEAANQAKDAANKSLVHRANELEERNRDALLLNEMGDLLESCHSAQEAYQVIAQSALKLFPGDSGALYAMRNSQNLVEAVALWGKRPEIALEHVFAPHECWALRRGRIHIVADTRTGTLCEHVNREGAAGDLPKCYLCIPMVAQSEMLGIFYVASHTEGTLTESKQRLAMSVAGHIALALSSLRLRETLQQQAIRDPLTGLFNRRYMTESLERELRRAERRTSSVGVVMVDLDHFKRVNDTYGHDVGDAFLRDLGHLLQTHVRQEDIACRLGGEEFTLILPETTLQEARLRAEQLREAITHLNVEYQNRSYGNLSASLGVAMFPAHGTESEAVLHAADTALYQAKTHGRNRVIVAPLPAQKQMAPAT